MEISELADLWGICLFQAGFSRYPLPFSLHGSGLNEFLWLPLTDKIAACYAAVCLADSPQADSLWMCTRQNILSFSPQCTFSGGQVSEPGQAGESEPGGRQGCTGKHQHENQL